jgi:hypothetical protein
MFVPFESQETADLLVENWIIALAAAGRRVGKATRAAGLETRRQETVELER